MNKVSVVIVDDEPLALKLLQAKLNKFEDVEIIGQGKNGREAINLVMELSPDLVFIDIQMPGLNGFEVVKHLQNDVLPLVVFVTAYEQYALDAFEVHAVDYILKPIDAERIERALTRAKDRLSLNTESNSKPRILSAIQTIRETRYGEQPPSVLTQKVESKIVIKEKDEITLLKQADIKWIDAAGDYVCLHVDGETHIKRSTMKELLDELDDSLFKRIHRSTIVNLNYIEKVIPHTKGEFFLQLGEYEKIKVSRNYKDAIKQFLQKE